MKVVKDQADGDSESFFYNKGIDTWSVANASNVLIDPSFGSGINSETDFSGIYKSFLIMNSWLQHSKYRLFNAASL